MKKLIQELNRNKITSLILDFTFLVSMGTMAYWPGLTASDRSEVFLNYGWLISISISAFLTMFYEHNQKRYRIVVALIVILSIINGWVVVSAINDGASKVAMSGVLFFYLVGGIIVGKIIATLLNFLFKTLNLEKTHRLYLVFGVFTLWVLGASYFIKIQVDASNKNSIELSKRFNLVKQLKLHSSNPDVNSISIQDLLEMENGPSLFTTKGDRIYHGYDGEITISSSDGVADITYLGIPAGESCHVLAYINTFGDYLEVSVNGTPTKIMGKVVKDLCLSSAKKFDINYKICLIGDECVSRSVGLNTWYYQKTPK